MSQTKRLAVAAALALLAHGCTGQTSSSGPPDPSNSLSPTTGTGGSPALRPNIVLVLTDDQRWDTVDAMPKVQRYLVEHGVSFREAFVVNPLCCPSRASILTGLYSHSTGVYTNGGTYGGFRHFDDSSTIATWLHSAGYRTALLGKYLNGYSTPQNSYVPPGWARWFVTTGIHGSGGFYNYNLSVDGQTVRRGDSAADYATDVLAEEAESVIRSTPSDQPLFLLFTPHAPHDPAEPAPRHQSEFADLKPYSSPANPERDVSDKPSWVRDLPQLSSAEQEEIARLRLYQYRSLLAVDDAVERIVRALEQVGRLEDSLIVFSSDNGLQWGEHGLTKKSVPYEESIRVPMILRYDRLVADPRTDSHLVTNIDLAPTFAELAGVDPPSVEGRSLVPLLTSKEPSWRSDFLIEHKGAGRSDAPTYCAVRNRDSIYVYYQTEEEELYDLKSDPHQLDNRASDPAMASTLDSLRARLLELCQPPPPGLKLPQR